MVQQVLVAQHSFLHKSKENHGVLMTLGIRQITECVNATCYYNHIIIFLGWFPESWLRYFLCLDISDVHTYHNVHCTNVRQIRWFICIGLLCMQLIHPSSKHAHPHNTQAHIQITVAEKIENHELHQKCVFTSSNGYILLVVLKQNCKISLQRSVGSHFLCTLLFILQLFQHRFGYLGFDEVFIYWCKLEFL